MRQIFSLDFDDPAEIDAIRQFLKFHAKRLACTEDKVILKLAEEFEKNSKVIDFAKEREKALKAKETPAPKGIVLKAPKRRLSNERDTNRPPRRS